MKVVLLQFGSITIYGYGLMLALGMVLCVALACARAKNHGLSADLMFNVAFFGIIVGLIGAKVMYWIVEIKSIIANPSLLLDLNSGLVVYGGLITGILFPLFYLKVLHKEKYLPYVEMAAPSISLAQGFGRIGCFLAGCCYGKAAPAGAWYAVVFPEGCSAPAGVELIPSQLISAGLDFLLFFFLWFMTNREKFMGQVLAMYCIFYSIGRFFVEMLRDDPRGSVGFLSTSQFVAIVILTIGLVLYAVFKRMNGEPFRKLDRETILAKEQEYKEKAKKK